MKEWQSYPGTTVSRKLSFTAFRHVSVWQRPSPSEWIRKPVNLTNNAGHTRPPLSLITGVPRTLHFKKPPQVIPTFVRICEAWLELSVGQLPPVTKQGTFLTLCWYLRLFILVNGNEVTPCFFLLSGPFSKEYLSLWKTDPTLKRSSQDAPFFCFTSDSFF